MTHYVSSSDYLAELPLYFNPAETPYILLKTDEGDADLQINCEYSHSEQFYYIYLSQFTEDFEIVITAQEGTYRTNVVIDTYDYERLEHWLNLQQLGYLIPVLKKYSWYKVKEAANIAAKLSKMQGTEYAVSELLRLLEVTGTVELKRVWQLVDSKAQDAWHSIALSDKGYKLTNEVLLQYKTGRIDINHMRVINSAKKMQSSIHEIAECIQKALPATITVTEAQIVYVALSILHIATTSMTTAVIESNTYAADKVSITDEAYFGKQHVTYDIQSKQVTMFDNKQFSSMCALLKLEFSQETEAVIYIDDLYFAHGTYNGTVNIVIGANDNVLPGEHIVKVQWFNATGNALEVTQTVTLHKDSGALDVYDFRAYASTDDLTSGEINAVGMYQLLTKHSHAIAKTYCRQDIVIPRYYLQVLVPTSAVGKELTIVNVDHEYKMTVTVERMFNLPDFNCQIQTIEDEYGVNDTTYTRTDTYFVLTSKTYASFVDYAFIIDGVVCNVLRTAYAGTINPMLYIKTLQYLGSMSNFKLDGRELAYTDAGNIASQLMFDEDIRLNFAYDQELDTEYLASISKDEQQMWFSCFASGANIGNTYVERQTSFYLHKVNDIKVGQPYLAIGDGTEFKLTYTDLRGEHTLLTSKDSIVFACSKSGKYTLYASNKYYDRQIQFDV